MARLLRWMTVAGVKSCRQLERREGRNTLPDDSVNSHDEQAGDKEAEQNAELLAQIRDGGVRGICGHFDTRERHSTRQRWKSEEGGG